MSMLAEPTAAFDPLLSTHPRGAAGVTRVRHDRLMPGVVAELGELVGVIYRPRSAGARRARTFIHFMREPPLLVHSMDGAQLYVVGGNYRVTARGLEG